MEVALVLEGGEVGVDRGRRRQPDRVADLPDARRVAPLAHLGVDELEHLPLAGGERTPLAGRWAEGMGAGLGAMEGNVTRSHVRGKHPFVFSLDIRTSVRPR